MKLFGAILQAAAALSDPHEAARQQQIEEQKQMYALEAEHRQACKVVVDHYKSVTTASNRAERCLNALRDTNYAEHVCEAFKESQAEIKMSPQEVADYANQHKCNAEYESYSTLYMVKMYDKFLEKLPEMQASYDARQGARAAYEKKKEAERVAYAKAAEAHNKKVRSYVKRENASNATKQAFLHEGAVVCTTYNSMVKAIAISRSTYGQYPSSCGVNHQSGKRVQKATMLLKNTGISSVTINGHLGYVSTHDLYFKD